MIDWDAGSWAPIERPGRSQKTLARVANGRQRFGDRFAFPYYSSGSGLTGRSIHRPIGTIMTINKWALVDGDKFRLLSIAESARAMGFPRAYKLPSKKMNAMKMLGNAVVPNVATSLCGAIMAAL